MCRGRGLRAGGCAGVTAVGPMLPTGHATCSAQAPAAPAPGTRPGHPALAGAPAPCQPAMGTAGALEASGSATSLPPRGQSPGLALGHF